MYCDACVIFYAIGLFTGYLFMPPIVDFLVSLIKKLISKWRNKK